MTLMVSSPPPRIEPGSTPPRSEVARQRFVSRATLVVALAAGLAVLIISLLSSSDTAHRTLAGTLTITPRSSQIDPCAPSQINPGLDDGTAIVVRDVNGKQVGSGRLGVGQVQGGSCVRSLDIEPVPELPEYRLVIGANGPLVVTQESLQASGGVLDLRFGA